MDYLEEARAKLGGATQQRTMEHLGMHRQQWTAIEKGSGISDKNAIRLARFLEIEPLEILAISHATSAKNREIREYWYKVGKSVVNQRLTEKSSRKIAS